MTQSERQQEADQKILKIMYEILAKGDAFYVTVRDIAELAGQGGTSIHKRLQGMAKRGLVTEAQRHYLPKDIHIPIMEIIKNIAMTHIDEKPAAEAVTPPGDQETNKETPQPV